MYRVIIARDHLGETVRLVRPEDELLGGPDVSIRLAFESNDYGEAVRVADLLERRIRTFTARERVSVSVRDGS
jgi:hypothetical protein